MPSLNRRAVILGAALAAAAAPGPWDRVWAQGAPVHLPFITHAAFFSKETQQSVPLDPQVFVKDGNAKAETGPQGIVHIDGFRPAHIVSDPSDTPVFTALGRALGFSLGQWLGAGGAVTITPRGAGATVRVRLKGLVPNGVYSLFENHFDQQPVGFTPLDGSGKRNSFTAKPDGTWAITVHAPQMLTSANAVLLVYHSDRLTHGASRGEIGVNAHHQLIAKLP
jgi:hypothetical protein